jgi:hypothetical protein
MTFDIFAWHRELLGAELTPGEFKALVSTATFADGSTGASCYPSAEQVAARANVGLRVVYRSWAKAEAAGLITKTQKRRETCQFQLLNVAELERWIPTKENQGLHVQTPSLARTDTKDCTTVHTNQTINQTNNPNQEESSSMSEDQGHFLSDEEMAANAAAAFTLPETIRITMHESMEKIGAVSYTEHQVRWKLNNGLRQHWRAGWNPWLMQFLPYITEAEHREWLGLMYTEGNVPDLKWHTGVVKRLMCGHEFVPHAPAPEPARTYGSAKPTLAERAADTKRW